jgi:hypothetical protein
MRFAPRVAVVLLALIPAACGRSAPSSSAQPAAGPEAYWSCQAISGATLYMSDVFAASAKREKITEAFFHRLNSKYGFQGVATCSMYAKTPDVLKRLQANNKRTIDFCHQGGRTVVETGWSY